MICSTSLYCAGEKDREGACVGRGVSIWVLLGDRGGVCPFGCYWGTGKVRVSVGVCPFGCYWGTGEGCVHLGVTGTGEGYDYLGVAGGQGRWVLVGVCPFGCYWDRGGVCPFGCYWGTGEVGVSVGV